MRGPCVAGLWKVVPTGVQLPELGLGTFALEAQGSAPSPRPSLTLFKKIEVKLTHPRVSRFKADGAVARSTATTSCSHHICLVLPRFRCPEGNPAPIQQSVPPESPSLQPLVTSNLLLSLWRSLFWNFDVSRSI